MAKGKGRRRYHQVTDGEWIAPRHRGYRDACCDCGLVHRMTYRVRAGQVEFRAVRDARATAAMRRRFRFEKED